MKTFKIQAFKKTLKVLVIIIIWQLLFSQHILAQNNINVVNPLHPNLGILINVNISNDFEGMSLINNGPNNNLQFYPFNNVAVGRKKTASSVKKTYATSNYKHQAKTANKAVNKHLAKNSKPKPIVKPKKFSQLPHKKASVTSASINKPAIEIQKLTDKLNVSEVRNVLPNPEQFVIAENTIIALPVIQSRNEINIQSNERKALSSDRNTNKINHHVYMLKRKKINHLRYSTNKKIAKLFAKSKKNKMLPAKCFAWS